MLKLIRILLVTAFVLTLAGAAALFLYNYTHEDTQRPVFKMDASEIYVSVNAGKEELRQGLHAYDNVDGDITSRILIRGHSGLIDSDTVKYTYIVFDNASNFTICERTVHYTDYIPPRFALSKPLIYNVGDTVTFLDRISANDVFDGNITGRLSLTKSTVVSTVPGIYDAELTVSNSLGDMAVLPVTVSIVNRTASMPEIRLNEYLIYRKAGESLFLYGNIQSVSDPLSDEPPAKMNVLINARSLDLNTPGIYEVYYYYTGISGEIATVTLTVVVE